VATAWPPPGPGGGQAVADAAGPDGPVTQVVARELVKPGNSPRLDGENADHIAVLAEPGVCWPPIVVHRPTMRVIDGMHRLRAAQLRGDLAVEVEFFDGDADEAFVAAVRANVSHGLPLTLADRKAAARRIVRSQPQRSDRWIGEVTGLAAGTVAAIRRQAGAAGIQGVSRLGRDGRVRPLSPADGRLRAQQEIRARPGASLREIARAAGISPATAKDVRDQLGRQDDPAAAHQRPAPPRRTPRPRTRPGGEVPGTGRSFDQSLHMLMEDPSLRYSESGRTVLRWLASSSPWPERVDEFISKVPAHCGLVIAGMARQRARQWLELAETLERRLRSKPQAQPDHHQRPDARPMLNHPARLGRPGPPGRAVDFKTG
jgi:ParB-like chromosome segregation protein Spo0J